MKPYPPCSRRFYGRWGGEHCYVQHEVTDIASWRECAALCYAYDHDTQHIGVCDKWSMKTQDRDMGSYVCQFIWDECYYIDDCEECEFISDALWQSGETACGK